MRERRTAGPLAWTLLLVVVANLVSACALPPPSERTLRFIQEAEAERARLTAAGFDQYTGGGSGGN
jgi:hypothetical protein